MKGPRSIPIPTVGKFLKKMIKATSKIPPAVAKDNGAPCSSEGYKSAISVSPDTQVTEKKSQFCQDDLFLFYSYLHLLILELLYNQIQNPFHIIEEDYLETKSTQKFSPKIKVNVDAP